MVNSSDERYQMVDQAICDAVFLFAKTKDPMTVTVAEICKKVGIVRSTFYNHYQDLPSLIQAVQQQSIDEIRDMLVHFRPKGNREICQQFYSSLCNYIADNGLLQQLLKWPEESSAFFEAVMEMFHEYVMQGTKTVLTERSAWAVSYSIGGAVGILHKWTRSSHPQEPDVIADMLTELFLKGPMAMLLEK
ncbi:MAG: TetR/AcrR family transcriptional regulator [Lachnospiraceae bacterium]|nr:TetR/AcrR family transcriptional regulator [Lachnospiraceae bacterium]